MYTAADGTAVGRDVRRRLSYGTAVLHRLTDHTEPERQRADCCNSDPAAGHTELLLPLLLTHHCHHLTDWHGHHHQSNHSHLCESRCKGKLKAILCRKKVRSNKVLIIII